MDSSPFSSKIQQLTSAAPKRVSTQLTLSERTPEAAAESYVLSKELKLPVAAVQSAMDQARRQADAQRIEHVLRGAPRITEWLQNTPEAGDLARDDLGNLGALENLQRKMFDGPRAIGAAIGRGVVRQIATPPALSARFKTQAVNDIGKSMHDLIREERETGAQIDAATLRAELRYMRAEAAARTGAELVRDRAAKALSRAAEITDYAASIPMSQPATRFRDRVLPAAENSVAGVLGAFASDPTGGAAFIVETAAEFIPAMAVLAATRVGPVGGAVGIGAASGGAEYGGTAVEALRSSGVSLDTPEAAMELLDDPELLQAAFDKAGARATIIAVMDAMSGGVAGTQLARSPLGDLVLQTMVQAAAGGGGEALAQVATGEEELQWADIIVEALAELVQTPGEVAVVGGKSLSRWLRLDQTAADNAEIGRATLQQLDGVVASSALRQRAPEYFQSAVEALGLQNESLYIDAATLASYYGEGFDAVLPELGLSRDEVDAAMVSGGDVAIPVDAYMRSVSGTEAQDFFHENAVLGADGRSVADAAQLKASAEELYTEAVARVREEIATDTAVSSEDAVIYEELYTQLQEAGRAPAAADAEARVFSAFFRTMGERYGVGAAAIAQRFGVRVQGPLETAADGTVFDQSTPPDDVDPKLVAVRDAPPLDDAARAELAAGRLPRDPDPELFLFPTEDAVRVPMSRLLPTRVRPGAPERAQVLMAEAALSGKRRGPLSIVPQSGGKFRVADGNSTYTALRRAGASTALARVFSEDGYLGEKQAAELRKIAKNPTKKLRRVDAQLMDEAEFKVAWVYLRRQQPYTSIEEMLDPAGLQADSDVLNAALQEATAAAGVEGWRPAPLKELASAQRKADDKYGGDFRLLGDVARGGFSASTVEQGDAVVDAIAAKFTIIDEGYVSTPSGYFDRKVNVLLPSGRWAELQVWPEGMYDAKELRGGHTMYEERRSKDVTPERAAELDAAMLDLYGQVAAALDGSWLQVLAETLRSNSALADFILSTPAVNSASEISGERSSLRTALASMLQEAAPTNMVAEPSGSTATKPGSDEKNLVTGDTSFRQDDTSLGDGPQVLLQPPLQKVLFDRGEYNAEEDPSPHAALRISTRFPSLDSSPEDPLGRPTLQIDTESLRAKPEAFEHNASLLADYVGFTDLQGRPADEIVRVFTERVVENLKWLHDNAPEVLRQRGHHWYDGARRITTAWSERYSLPDTSIAGVLAALSPQKDWFQNVSLAERVLDIMTSRRDVAWDAAMTEQWRSRPALAKSPEMLPLVEGRTLQQVLDTGDLVAAALWVRVYDETFNDPIHAIVSPEGGIMQSSGKKVGWGSLAEITKAVSVIVDPSLDNVSRQMGGNHKVRSFYNNIVSPMSTAGDVTIDTHAVAAALLRPLSQSTTEVSSAFGTGLAPKKQPPGYRAPRKVGVAGARGLYAIYADAYRAAAADLGILPRQLQSITWEAVRLLFPDRLKSGKMPATIDALWEQGASPEETRNAIASARGAFPEPAWAGPGSSDADPAAASTYSGPVPEDRRAVGGGDDAGAGGERAGGAAAAAGRGAATGGPRVLGQPAVAGAAAGGAAAGPDGRVASIGGRSAAVVGRFGSDERPVLEVVDDGLAAQRDATTTGQPLQQEGARGSITIPAGGVEAGVSVVSLFSSADLSTVLHEASHFFLEAFTALASDPSAPQQMKDDLATIRKFLDVPEGVSGYTRDQHEKFARGGEAYFMEGKAPTLELADAFARFRSWLVYLYKSVRGLNVRLTEEVRDVFDRMLATDAEIADARAGLRMQPLFAEKPAGMTDYEWNVYQRMARRGREEADRALLAKTMQKLRRERTAEYKAEQKAVRAVVSEQVNAQPVYRLIEALGNQRVVGSDEDVGDLRMDRNALVEMFGEGVLADLDRTRLGGRRALWTDGGMDPAEVAQFFGFSSPAAMIDQLRGAVKRTEAIDAEVERRMTATYGDTLTDGTLEEEALRAVHSAQQLASGVLEVRHLAERTGRPSAGLTARVYRARAQQLIGQMRVAVAARPAKFLRAERAAARAAQQAFARVAANAQPSDAALAEAFQAKEQQVLNQFLYDEALKLEKLVDDTRQKMRSFDLRRVRKKVEGGDIEQIDAIRQQFDFRIRSGPQRANAESLRTFVDRMIAEGRAADLNIDQRVIDDARRRHFSQLSVDEFRGVRDTVDNLEHLGRRAQVLADRRRERKLQEVVDNVVQTVLSSHKPRDNSTIHRGLQALNLVWRPDTILVALDGGQEYGPAYEALKLDIDRGQAEEQRMGVEMVDRLDAIFSEHYSKAELRDMQKPRSIEHYGGARMWSKAEILAVALNTGNEDNYRRLTSPDVPDPASRLTQPRLQALLRQMDERDWKFVQAIWDQIDSYWPELAAVHKRRTGTEPAKVPAKLMVPAPRGVRGGYYPIAYDPSKGGKVATEELEVTIGGQYSPGLGATAAVANGMTKSRLTTVTDRMLLFDLSVAFRHMREVSRYIALSEAVDNANRVLTHKDFVTALRSIGQEDTLRTLQLWLQDTARGPVFNTDLANWFFRTVKNNFTLSRLSLNLKTVFLQATGLGQSAATIGKRNMIRGLATYMRHPGQMISDVTAASPFMAERSTTFQKDIYDFMNAAATTASPLQSRKDAAVTELAKIGFWPMIKMQFLVVDMPTWLGAYQQGLKTYDGDQQRAVLYADSMVRRAQDSGLMADRAAVERGTLSRHTRQSDVVRFFTTLGGYMLTKLNRASVTMMKARLGIREADDVPAKAAIAASAAVDLSLLFAFEAALMGLIYSLQAGGDEDDEALQKFLMAEVGMAVVGGVPLVRDAANAFRGYGEGGTYGSVMASAGKAANQLAQMENDRAARRAMADLIGLVTGLPTTATLRAYEGILNEDGDGSAFEALFGTNPLTR